MKVKTKFGLLRINRSDYARLPSKGIFLSGEYPSVRVSRRETYKGTDVLWYCHIAIHRLVMRALTGEFVDHRDGDKMNCLRANLRKCDQGENLRNRPKSRNNTSGYKGVRKHGANWYAIITKDRQRKNLGTYSCPEVAARVWDREAITWHGEFAHLNFPEDKDTAASYTAPKGSCRSREKSKYGTGVYFSEGSGFYAQVSRNGKVKTIATGISSAKEAQTIRRNYLKTEV